MSNFIGESVRDDLKRLLEQAAATCRGFTDLDEIRAEPALETFRSAGEKLGDILRRYEEPYRLAIVGDFKVGKSSLINALLGAPGLVAEGIVPTTGAVTELWWGETPSGQVLDRGGAVLFEGTPEEAARFADQRTPEGRRVERKGTRVVLRTPLEVLRRMTIVDTPGLGASELDDEVTRESLHVADAAVLVLNAERPGGQGAVQLAERLRAGDRRVTCVLTRADLVSAADLESGLAEVASVFRDVLDGPPIGFASPRVASALARLSDSAMDQDEASGGEARRELETWGYAPLRERILQGHLSASGEAGLARARAALGDVRKIAKFLRTQAGAEHDAAEKRERELRAALDETERVVLEVLGPKVPFIEDKIEEFIDARVGEFISDMREALEVLIDRKADEGVAGGMKALWSYVDDSYAERLADEAKADFDSLFPRSNVKGLSDDIDRAVRRLLEMEWRNAIRESTLAAGGEGVNIVALMKQIDRHLAKVTATILAQVVSFILLFFVPGGFIANLGELVASLAVGSSQMSKAEARIALTKREAGVRLRNERKTLSRGLAAHYREVNGTVHAEAVARTRQNSSEQQRRRDASAAAATRWREAVKDLSGITEAAASFELGGRA